jgi:hypothetical protein
MENHSSVSPYLCHVIGECPKRASRFHISTKKRTEALAIAIHIPVLLWAVTGFLIARGVFSLSDLSSGLIAVGCALTVYLIERIILATPKSPLTSVVRFFIGLVIAILGASAVDLVIFEREIEKQLVASNRSEIESQHQKRIDKQTDLVGRLRADWRAAQEQANCEANGTCGSRIRSTGPVYRGLARHAENLRAEYVVANQTLESLMAAKDSALATYDAGRQPTSDAGILARIQALHDYTSSNVMAQAAWLLFFLLVLFFELMVVFCKMVFGETVDDELEQIREEISQQKARGYREAVLSPTAGAFSAIDNAYR